MRLMRLVLVASAILAMGARRTSAEGSPELAKTSTPEKSSGLALGLSAGLPATGYAMIIVSALPSGNIQTWQTVGVLTGASLALIGPSGGNFYTGHVGRGLAFSAGRLVLSLLGTMAVAEGITHGDTSESDYDKGAVRTATIEVALCGAGILGLTLWESIDTYRSAEALKRASRPALAVAPLLVPNRESISVAGLVLAGRY